MSVLYILPKRNFFKKGFTGSVMHALGIIEGLGQNEIETFVFAHVSSLPDEILKKIRGRLVPFKGYYSKYVLVWRMIKRKSEEDRNFKIIVRYSFSQVFYLFYLAWVCRRFRISSILEVNTLYCFYEKTKFNEWLERIELFFCKSFTTIYVVSPNSMDFFRKKGFSNVIYVPNGIIAENYNVDLPYDFRPKRLKYFGSVKHYYNLDFLINKIKPFPYVLELYGNVSKDFIQKHSNNPQIIFKGKYLNKDIYSLVNPNKDILVLPYKSGSIADFGFPTKLGEYLSLGCLILTTDTGVLKTIFKNRVNAVVYTDYNEESLAEAFNYISVMNLKDLMRMIRNAKEEVKHYQWKHLVNFIYNEKSFIK